MQRQSGAGGAWGEASCAHASCPRRLCTCVCVAQVSVGVLCYDEVQMMDIADATVLRGVLQALVGAGWVLVATCNRTPAEFAASTMQREHPQSRFAEAMAEHCDTLQLGDGARQSRGLEPASRLPPDFALHARRLARLP